MKFNLFNSNLKIQRENYVKQFKVDNIEITPCEKFVACLEKLSKNYVLALQDTATTETLQIANQNDIEFFEGYELSPNYTNSLRHNLCKKIYNVYKIIYNIVNGLEVLENKIKTYNTIEDYRLELKAINNVVQNIYKHLTLTNNDIRVEVDNEIPANLEQLIEYVKQLITTAITELMDINAATIINYITKQINYIVLKLQQLLNQI